MVRPAVVTRSLATITLAATIGAYSIGCGNAPSAPAPKPVEKAHLQCIQLADGTEVKGFPITREYVDDGKKILLQGIAVPQFLDTPFEVFGLQGGAVAYHNGVWYSGEKQPCGKSMEYVWACTPNPLYQDSACGSLLPKPQ